MIERALNAGYEPLAVLIEEKQADDLIPKLFFAYPELPVYTAKFDLLTNLTGFALTRGLLCDEDSRFRFIDMEKLGLGISGKKIEFRRCEISDFFDLRHKKNLLLSFK